LAKLSLTECGGTGERLLPEVGLTVRRLTGATRTRTPLSHGGRGDAQASRVHGPARLAGLHRLTGGDTGSGTGRRLRLLSEQFLALEHDPDGERDQRGRGHADRDVHQRQLAGCHPADENPDGGHDQHGAEPDHLSVISSSPIAPEVLLSSAAVLDRRVAAAEAAARVLDDLGNTVSSLRGRAVAEGGLPESRRKLRRR